MNASRTILAAICLPAALAGAIVTSTKDSESEVTSTPAPMTFVHESGQTAITVVPAVPSEGLTAFIAGINLDGFLDTSTTVIHSGTGLANNPTLNLEGALWGCTLEPTSGDWSQVETKADLQLTWWPVTTD